MATAIAYPRRMPWTTFPRINLWCRLRRGLPAQPFSSRARRSNMQTFHNRLLFFLAVVLALHPFGYSQVRESGTGAPGPVKAQHLAAELISDSGTIAPAGKSRVALALTLEPGWHVYWVYAGDSGEPLAADWSVHSGFPLGRCSIPRLSSQRFFAANAGGCSLVNISS